MSFTSLNGYIPRTIESILEAIRVEVNVQFSTTFTTENFVGSNWYKYAYAIAQEIQKNEVKTSEIFLKLTQYFSLVNDMIARPVATPPGLIGALATAGYIASVKPPLNVDAGKLFVCVDVDSGAPTYAATKLAINTLLSHSVAAGIVTQGAQVNTIVLSNGQPFDFKFALPDVTTPKLKLTVTLSDNNQVAVDSPEEMKFNLMANIAARYRLGRDFEPQRYFSTLDAPWASEVKLEYSLDSGATWLSTIFEADFDDIFRILLANITVVEN